MLNSRLDWDDLEVLDLYSGSGAITFEFLSRGVKSVVALDNNNASVRFISDMKQQWDVDNLEVLKYDTLRYLENCRTAFDVVFADPPYHSEDYDLIHELVFSRDLLKENGYLIMEHRKDLNFEDKDGFLLHRAFGNVNFSIFSPVKSVD